MNERRTDQYGFQVFARHITDEPRSFRCRNHAIAGSVEEKDRNFEVLKPAVGRYRLHLIAVKSYFIQELLFELIAMVQNQIPFRASSRTQLFRFLACIRLFPEPEPQSLPGNRDILGGKEILQMRISQYENTVFVGRKRNGFAARIFNGVGGEEASYTRQIIIRSYGEDKTDPAGILRIACGQKRQAAGKAQPHNAHLALL